VFQERKSLIKEVLEHMMEKEALELVDLVLERKENGLLFLRIRR
jgi:hypothetical protein